jgi:hypothetical protein
MSLEQMPTHQKVTAPKIEHFKGKPERNIDKG